MIKRRLEDIKYYPLFTEGKEWTWYHFRSYIGQYSTDAIITVKVNGSKTIEGIECKRLTIDVTPVSQNGCYYCNNWFNRNEANSRYHDKFGCDVGIPEEVYVYEKDRKIYYYKNPGIRLNAEGTGIEIGEPYFALMMDQNISIDDKVGDYYMVTGDDLIDINGKPHRRISKNFIPDPDFGFTVAPSPDVEWVEGIGGLTNHNYGWNYQPCYGYYADKPEDNDHENEELTGFPTFYYTEVAHVKDNGKVIYDRTDALRELGLDVPTAVASVETEGNYSGICFDLQGRRIDENNHKGLYIRNGKILFKR